jgi:hypothetical protein
MPKGTRIPAPAPDIIDPGLAGMTPILYVMPPRV